MTQQGTILQNCNNEMVKYLEDLHRKCTEINQSILKKETEKAKIQKELSVLTDKLSNINKNLAQKMQMRDEYNKIILETKGAYEKILESSQTLLNTLKNDSVNLEQKNQFFT